MGLCPDTLFETVPYGDDDIGGKLGPLGHSAGDYRGRRGAEHRLERQKALFRDVGVRIERETEKMRCADESVAGGMHKGEAQHPEEECAYHEVYEILHQDVGRVLGTGESGLHQREARLHKENKHGCQEHPYGVQAADRSHDFWILEMKLFSVCEHRVPVLPCPDGPGVVNRADEYAPVPHLTGTRRLHDGVYCGLHELVAAHYRDFDTGDDVRAVHHAAVDAVLPVLADGLYFRIGKPVDVGGKKCGLDLLKVGFPDNCFDFFHKEYTVNFCGIKQNPLRRPLARPPRLWYFRGFIGKN